MNHTINPGERVRSEVPALSRGERVVDEGGRVRGYLAGNHRQDLFVQSGMEVTPHPPSYLGLPLPSRIFFLF
jgi:hypothetical protein